MSSEELIKNEKFWDVLRLLFESNYPAVISDLAKVCEISERELNSYLNFVKEVGCSVVVDELNGQKQVDISGFEKSFNIEFSFFEWLSFQAHFPIIASAEHEPYHEPLKQKLASTEYEFRDFDLFEPLKTIEEVLNHQPISLLNSVELSEREVLDIVEESIVDKKAIQLQLQGSSVKALPHKIVYFDGGLNLIAEELSDRCLIRMFLKNVKSVIELTDEFKPEYTSLEIDDFVSSLRAMSENQVRLVLKIHSTQKFNLNFNKMFLDKPCLFTNPQGDFIWAATLEPSNEIFEWLCELGSSVEILDPMNFKVKFLKYCEDKLKKIA